MAFGPPPSAASSTAPFGVNGFGGGGGSAQQNSFGSNLGVKDATNAPFSFGNSNQNFSGTSTFNFGNANTNSSTPFTFGSSTSNQTSFGNNFIQNSTNTDMDASPVVKKTNTNNANTFSFGTTSSTSNTSGGGNFTFGSAPSTGTSLFTFGGTPSAQAQPSTTTAPANKPFAFSFGQGQGSSTDANSPPGWFADPKQGQQSSTLSFGAAPQLGSSGASGTAGRQAPGNTSQPFTFGSSAAEAKAPLVTGFSFRNKPATSAEPSKPANFGTPAFTPFDATAPQTSTSEASAGVPGATSTVAVAPVTFSFGASSTFPSATTTNAAVEAASKPAFPANGAPAPPAASAAGTDALPTAAANLKESDKLPDKPVPFSFGGLSKPATATTAASSAPSFSFGPSSSEPQAAPFSFAPKLEAKAGSAEYVEGAKDSKALTTHAVSAPTISSSAAATPASDAPLKATGNAPVFKFAQSTELKTVNNEPTAAPAFSFGSSAKTNNANALSFFSSTTTKDSKSGVDSSAPLEAKINEESNKPFSFTTANSERPKPDNTLTVAPLTDQEVEALKAKSNASSASPEKVLTGQVSASPAIGAGNGFAAPKEPAPLVGHSQEAKAPFTFNSTAKSGESFLKVKGADDSRPAQDKSSVEAFSFGHTSSLAPPPVKFGFEKVSSEESSKDSSAKQPINPFLASPANFDLKTKTSAGGRSDQSFLAGSTSPSQAVNATTSDYSSNTDAHRWKNADSEPKEASTKRSRKRASDDEGDDFSKGMAKVKRGELTAESDSMATDKDSVSVAQSEVSQPGFHFHLPSPVYAATKATATDSNVEFGTPSFKFGANGAPKADFSLIPPAKLRQTKSQLLYLNTLFTDLLMEQRLDNRLVDLRQACQQYVETFEKLIPQPSNATKLSGKRQGTAFPALNEPKTLSTPLQPPPTMVAAFSLGVPAAAVASEEGETGYRLKQSPKPLKPTGFSFSVEPRARPVSKEGEQAAATDKLLIESNDKRANLIQSLPFKGEKLERHAVSPPVFSVNTENVLKQVVSQDVQKDDDNEADVEADGSGDNESSGVFKLSSNVGEEDERTLVEQKAVSYVRGSVGERVEQTWIRTCVGLLKLNENNATKKKRFLMRHPITNGPILNVPIHQGMAVFLVEGEEKNGKTTASLTFKGLSSNPSEASRQEMITYLIKLGDKEVASKIKTIVEEI